MSKAKYLYLFLSFLLLFSSLELNVARAQSPVAIKNVPSSKMSAAELALACTDLPTELGIRDLCKAVTEPLTSAINALGTSISSALSQMASNFMDLIVTKVTELVARFTGSFFEVMGGMLWAGQYPVTQTASAIDQQHPSNIGILPLRLILEVYKNAPDLGTMSSLAYVVNNNILGIKTSFAQTNCVAWAVAHPGETCPGRLRLAPMFAIWQGIRNIAYISITLILIVYGFMVMFRSKIDPRTVITLQSVIPRLAIGLVAIAFSYTIASLMVDLGQVGLSTVGLFYRNLQSGGAARPCAVVNNPCLPFPYLEDPRQLQSNLGTKLDFQVANTFGWPWDGLVSTILGLVLWYMLFQIFFALVTNYAQIFVKAALGPILIAFGILPSQNEPIKKWVLGLLGNALVFPGIYFILNMAVYLNNYEANLQLPQPISQFDVKAFVILGLFIICTKVPAIIEEFLGTQSSGAVGRAGADIGQIARKIPVVGGLLG